MAKITGPLMSLGASGTIAKTLVTSRWKGRPYIRQHVVPANPNTTAQQNVRGLFANSQALYKQSPDIAREPWQRYVNGQVMTEWNAFTKFFVQDNNGQADLAQMTFSPGAKGGLAPIALALTPVAGQITADITAPAAPTGWTLVGAQAVIIADGDPAALTDFTWQADEDLAAPFSIVFTGLAGTTTYAVGAWLKFTKPDGSLAYGPSLTDLDTTP